MADFALAWALKPTELSDDPSARVPERTAVERVYNSARGLAGPY